MSRRRRRRRPAEEMKRLMALAIFLVFILLPLLAFLWYSGVLGGEAFAAVPYEELLKERNIMRSRKLYVRESTEAGVLILPGAEEVSLKMNTAECLLDVSLTDAGRDDVEDAQELTISADLSLVESAELYQQGDTKHFYFTLCTMCVAEWEAEGETLRITLTPLSEWVKNGTVLVLQDGGGSSTLIQETERLLSGSNSGIHVFSLAEGYAGADEFAKLSSADIYLRVTLAEDEENDAATYALCNPGYYIPGLDSVLLAEIMERNMLAKLKSPAGDIVELPADDPLCSLSIPACEIVSGRPSAESGDVADSRDEYIQAAAAGLADGIREALLLRW